MLVTGHRLDKKLEDKSFTLQVLNNSIEQVTSEKLLGVQIDTNLTFDDRIDELTKKVAQKIGVLKSIKSNLPIKEWKLIYNSMIKSIMSYGSTVWGSCLNESIEKVFKMQKRAARVILDADMKERSSVIFKKLNWLPIRDEIAIRKYCLIYKRINSAVPDYINDILKRNADLHTRLTRNASINLVCPKFKRETEGGRTFQVTSAKLWNSIPVDIKKRNSYSSFNLAIRKYFLVK